MYAIGRIGIFSRLVNNYQYELSDHLGNIRVVINRNKNVNGQANVSYCSDYYPFGSPLTLANNDYRYGYQGQHAEVDKETSWNNFDFRMYDAQIGRWLSTDPMGQYASPYLGMGNDPLNRVDPDGFGIYSRDQISAKQFNFSDRFASSNDFSVKFTYDLIDAPYV
ncbi:RHS repeat-associated core domain-containing protein [Pedobacter frigidisoli]|uniref:RHS repeat-associated core domain-containing protein n=1 Tax=Pedobacter frigidisoli TaxID=2530455 RepID=UPI00292D9A2F|nr:RHS repeat-associated core domain-containing protein [Pedobacter frigidisoli]